MIVEKGCRYALYFHYMPVGNDASLELLPNPKQRLYIKDRVREIRNMTSGKGIFTMDFQNDGEFVGGCIAEEETTSISMQTAMLSHVYLSTTQEPTSVHTACLRF